MLGNSKNQTANLSSTVLAGYVIQQLKKGTCQVLDFGEISLTSAELAWGKNLGTEVGVGTALVTNYR